MKLCWDDTLLSNQTVALAKVCLTHDLQNWLVYTEILQLFALVQRGGVMRNRLGAPSGELTQDGKSLQCPDRRRRLIQPSCRETHSDLRDCSKQ